MRMRYTFVALIAILGVALVGCAPSGSSLSPVETPSAEGTLTVPGGSDMTPSGGATPGFGDMTPSSDTTPSMGDMTPSGGTPSADTTPGLPGTGSSVPAKIDVNQQGSSGPYLVDDKGLALYAFTNDTADTSTCTDACAQTWRPVTTGGAPEAGSDVDEMMLGTISRSDGTTQVTYNHMPLYYYADDAAAGDTNGQGLNSKWYLVSPEGTMIKQ